MPRQLVAVRAGFYGLKFIEPGEAFLFRGEKAPKWAREVTDPAPAAKATLRADTKPAAAAKASKAKAAASSDPADQQVV